MSINPDNNSRDLNSSPNYYERAISFPLTILSNISLFAHFRATHMAFQVRRLEEKKSFPHNIVVVDKGGKRKKLSTDTKL